MNELLKQVRLLDPTSQTDRIADVLITDGIVTAVEDAIADYPSNATIYEGSGLILAPGLVDLYSHSGEPGFEERETLKSLMQAAAAGGFTRIAILPDTAPALDHLASIAWLHDQANLQSIVSVPLVQPWAALTQEVKGQQLTELAELATADIAGFADGKPLQNLMMVRRLLEYLQPLGKPIMLWACDRELTGNGVMREGSDSIQIGLPGIPAIAETAALSALLECIEATGTPVHLMRISTARGVELIRKAKERGLPITASTSWMHLLLNTQMIASYDSNLRLDPPLGTPADQTALIDAVHQGVIDAIAIDHRPYTYEEKTVPFAEAPPGAIGLELALPLLWHRFVESGLWTAIKLWSVLSTRPAICLQQKPPEIAIGQPAEMLLFDPQHFWLAKSHSLKSSASNTPWLDQDIQGQVIKTWRY
ncbi:dihydroorotase [Phormidium sp. CLA17]|uniref:dihydroorotase n=1 Tax=Leptolyngbya sp. Cla-17 TaxID=2803751 RepID=UPI0014923277|nr:dihydroorotase [Leptolyngbya sp. Cla-17]MBM0741396.1 dihydroorotase [Leptolyngbya sp. Cla-17]